MATIWLNHNPQTLNPQLSLHNPRTLNPQLSLQASLNLRVKLSDEGRQARGISADVEALIGFISEVETDGRMCKVSATQGPKPSNSTMDTKP